MLHDTSVTHWVSAFTLTRSNCNMRKTHCMATLIGMNIV